MSTNTAPSDRAYKPTDIPTLRPDVLPKGDRELLLKIYEQTCTTWRMLVDVRFKLLALVPAASLIALATIFGTTPEKQTHPRLLLAFALLGLVAITGLLIYELRNSQLHDDLISRGRKIEDELGVHTAVFRGRRNPTSRFVSHSTATNLIYGSAMFAWVVAAISAARALLA
jgi:hypothetical protein